MPSYTDTSFSPVIEPTSNQPAPESVGWGTQIAEEAQAAYQQPAEIADTTEQQNYEQTAPTFTQPVSPVPASHLTELVQDPRFYDEPPERQNAMFENVANDIRTTHGEMDENTYKSYSKFVDAARASYKDSTAKWALKKAKGVGEGAVDLVTGLSTIAPAAVSAGIGPLTSAVSSAISKVSPTSPLVDAFNSPADTAKAALSTVASTAIELGTNLIQAVSNQLSPRYHGLKYYVNTLEQGIKDGSISLHSKAAIDDVIKRWDKVLLPEQIKRQGEKLGKANSISSKESRQMLELYAATRDPALLDAIIGKVLLDKSTLAIQEMNEKLAKTKGMENWRAAFGEKGVQALQSGWHFSNFLGGMGIAGKLGAKALLVKHFPKATAAHMVTNFATHLIEPALIGGVMAVGQNPQASLSDIGESALNMALLAGTIHGVTSALKSRGKAASETVADAPPSYESGEVNVTPEAPIQEVPQAPASVAPQVEAQGGKLIAPATPRPQVDKQSTPIAEKPTNPIQPKSEPTVTPEVTEAANVIADSADERVAATATPEKVEQYRAQRSDADQRMRERGLTPPPSDHVSWTEANLVGAAKKMVQTEGYADALLDDFVAHPERPMTPLEVQVLQLYEKQLDAARSTATPEQLAIIDQRLEDKARAVKNRGSAWGSFGRSLQLNTRGQVPKLENMLIDRKDSEGFQASSPESQTKQLVEIRAEHAAMETLHKEQTETLARIEKAHADYKQSVAEGTQISPAIVAAIEVTKARKSSAGKASPKASLSNLFKQAQADAAANAAKADPVEVSKVVAWADNKIAESRKQFNSGIDPELLAAYAVKGAELFAKGFKDLAAWTKEMTRLFGEEFSTVMQKQAAYEASPAGLVADFKGEVTGDINRPLARDVAKAHITEALDEGRELGDLELTHLVKESLRPLYGDHPTNTVREAWTNYGKPKQPTIDEVAKHFEELKRRARLNTEIFRIESKLKLLKSGQQRAKSSEEVRTLTKQRDELMVKYNVEPKDPTVERASRRTRVVSALNNQIETLKAVIDGTQYRVEKSGKPFLDDAEITGLREEVKVLQQREREMRAEDPAIAADAAARIRYEKGAESYRRKTAAETLPEAKKEAPALSEGTDAARKDKEKAKKDYQDFLKAHPTTQAKIAAEKVAEYAREEAALDARIQSAEAELQGKASPMPKKPGQAGPPEHADKLQKLYELRENAKYLKQLYKDLNPVAKVPKTAAERDAIFIQIAQGREKNYRIKAALKDFTKAEKFDYSEAVKAAKDAAQSARDAYEAARDADPVTIEERNANDIKALDERIVKASKELKDAQSGLFNQPKGTKVNPILVSRLAELAKIRESISNERTGNPTERRNRRVKAIQSGIEREKKWLDGKRKTGSALPPLQSDMALSAAEAHLKFLRDYRASLAEEVANKEKRYMDNRAKQLTKQEEKLRQQIKDVQSGKLPEVKKRKEREYDQRVLDLQVQVFDSKAELAERVLRLQIQNLTGAAKVSYYAGQVLRLQRDVLGSFDISHTARQGLWFNINHPLIGFRNFKKMLSSFRSKKGYVKADEYIKNNEYYKNGYVKKSGMKMTDITSSDATMREDMASGNWGKDLAIVAGSGRAYTTAANLQRIDIFSSKVKRIEKNGYKMTDTELADLGNYINKGTGWGSVKGLSDAAMSGAGHLLYSPRLAAARVNMIFAEPFFSAHKSPKIQRIIFEDYVKFWGLLLAAGAGAGAMATAAYGALPNGESRFEINPLSGNFFKPRIGKNGQTRLEITGGLSSYLTFVARLLAHRTKNKKGEIVELSAKDYGDLVWSFSRSKLAPFPASSLNFGSGSDVVGGAATAGSTLFNGMAPMPINSVYEAFSDNESIFEGTLFSALSLSGFGTTSYDSFDKSTKEELMRGKENGFYFDVVNKAIEEGILPDVSIQRHKGGTSAKDTAKKIQSFFIK